MRLRTSTLAAAAIFCAVAFSPLSGATENRTVAGLRAAPLPAPLLLAQSGPPKKSCTDDGKNYPSGSRRCVNTEELVCRPTGTWERTGRNC